MQVNTGKARKVYDAVIVGSGAASGGLAVSRKEKSGLKRFAFALG